MGQHRQTEIRLHNDQKLIHEWKPWRETKGLHHEEELDDRKTDDGDQEQADKPGFPILTLPPPTTTLFR